MKRMVYLFILFSFLNQVQGQSNYYDLSIGTIRYYDYCQSYYLACAADYRNVGIEEIIGDTLIDSHHYAVVKWKSETITDDSVTKKEEISYYRFGNELLYKYTSAGDSILQDFSFSKGDTLSKYYSEADMSSFFITPPNAIIYDTLITFTDNSPHRIMWGDDTTHIYNFEATIIPDMQTFLDSILIDQNEIWLLPFGNTQTYYPNTPFYFVDSLGILYSEWNYRKMALVGVQKSDGTLFGQEVKFLTDIENLNNRSITTFNLFQNFPNPFNPVTNIGFQLSQPGEVEILIFNYLGQKLFTLFSGHKTAGYHKIKFDASNFASGIYLYRLTVNGNSITKKMLYLR